MVEDFKVAAKRRRFLKLIGAGGAAAMLPGFPAGAQEAYPTRQIQFVAPFSAGGSTDAVARQSGQFAAARLGQPIVVENRTGAAGAIGFNAIFRARPDGYLLGQYLGNLTLLSQTADVQFNPLQDFTYIIGLAVTSMGITVRADSPYKTFNDLVAAAKAKPDTITVAHSGVATGGHVVCSELEQLGIRFRQIPFKGAEWIQALLGGHVDAIAGTISYSNQLDSGAFRMLATFGDTRTSKYSGVPTARELGYPVVYLSGQGVMGPKGLPASMVRTLHDAFKGWTETANYRKTLEDFQLDPWYRSSADLEKWVQEQYKQDKVLAERLGIVFKR